MDGNLILNWRTGDFLGLQSFTSFTFIAAGVGAAVCVLVSCAFHLSPWTVSVPAGPLDMQILLFYPTVQEPPSFDLTPAHCPTMLLSHSAFPTTFNSYALIGIRNWLHV